MEVRLFDFKFIYVTYSPNGILYYHCQNEIILRGYLPRYMTSIEKG